MKIGCPSSTSRLASWRENPVKKYPSLKVKSVHKASGIPALRDFSLAPMVPCHNLISPAADISVRDAMESAQDCRQCGTCCEKWGWDQKGITEDLVPWIIARRFDILRHVSIRVRDGRQFSGRNAPKITLEDLPDVVRISYWVDPDGRTLHYCPFYFRKGDGKVYCRIHDTKPAVCTGFAPWKEIYHDYGLNCPACRNSSP